MIRETLQKHLLAAIKDLGLQSVPFTLEHPGDLAHGDYATNIALAAARKMKESESPRAIAERLVAILESRGVAEVEKIEVAGPGFINFFLTREFFTKEVKNILAAGETWGRLANLSGQRIMVEYTQPNPFKVFHIGHLMSNAIGEALSRTLEYAGATIKRANYQGDVGPHVARAIWGIQKLSLDPSEVEALGRAYVAGSDAYDNEEKAKEEIHEINRKVYEKSDRKINEIYEIGRGASLRHFEGIYKKLGTQFDHYFFESETGPLGKSLVEENPNVFEKSDGAMIFRGEKYGLHTRVFVNSEGFPTYEAKDLGLAKQKAGTWPFDISITVTASEQSDYFKVVKAAMGEVYSELSPKIKHVAHGMMRFASGKMSSRKGNVITGESLIKDVEERVAERMKETRATEKDLAIAVAVGAIKYAVLRQGAGKDIIFDIEKSLSLEGDSGPYLQYAHARALSVIEKGKDVVMEAAKPLPRVYEVERLLYRFPEVVKRAAEEYEPHYVTTYLTDLAGAFNAFYAKERIIDDKKFGPYKLALTKAFALTMKSGLWLLGIAAPERM